MSILPSPTTSPAELVDRIDGPLPPPRREYQAQIYVHPSHLPTSLEPTETTVDSSVATTLRSPRWARAAIPLARSLARIFEAAPDDALARQGLRMSMCMEHPSLRLRSDGTPYLSLDRCRCRCCPICAPFRARRTSERIRDALAGVDQLRHIVLTLPSTDGPLKDQLDHLTASFRRLRQTKTWKQSQLGSLATIQITLPEKSGRWHPHLHILASGEYLPHAELKAAWMKCSGGASIVWITSVTSRKTATSYIAQYVAAEEQLTKWPPAALLEFASAMVGRRSVIATGCFHGSKLPAADTDDEPKGSTYGVNLRVLARAVRHQLPEALYLRAWCSNNSPWAASMLPDLAEAPGPDPAAFDDVPSDLLAGWVQRVADFVPGSSESRPPPSRGPTETHPVLFRHT